MANLEIKLIPKAPFSSYLLSFEVIDRQSIEHAYEVVRVLVTSGQAEYVSSLKCADEVLEDYRQVASEVIDELKRAADSAAQAASAARSAHEAAFAARGIELTKRLTERLTVQ